MVRLTRDPKRDHQALLSVGDDGPGIEIDLQANAFERCVRADDSRSRAIGSTGLGLSIAHAVVRAHGGEGWDPVDQVFLQQRQHRVSELQRWRGQRDGQAAADLRVGQLDPAIGVEVVQRRVVLGDPQCGVALQGGESCGEVRLVDEDPIVVELSEGKSAASNTASSMRWPSS